MPHYGESSYRRYLLGDLNALEDLVREYSDAMVRFAYCFVKDTSAAEDVMEDALTDLLLKKKRFPSEAHFKAYLYKAVRHRALDYLRRNRSHIPLEDVENILSCEDSQTDILKQQRNEVLYICMGSLPEQYREVLILSYFEELDPEQICTVMGKNKKQVYNLLARSKSTLRQLLEKEGISHEDL